MRHSILRHMSAVEHPEAVNGPIASNFIVTHMADSFPIPEEYAVGQAPLCLDEYELVQGVMPSRFGCLCAFIPLGYVDAASFGHVSSQIFQSRSLCCLSRFAGMRCVQPPNDTPLFFQSNYIYALSLGGFFSKTISRA